MSDGKIVKAHCPSCGPEIRAEVLNSAKRREADEHDFVWGQSDYRTLECQGCGAVYFQEISVFSEDTDHKQDPATGEWQEYLIEKIAYYPPRLKRKLPDWLHQLDYDLYSMMKDLYKAFSEELNVLTAIGIRTAFDKSTEALGVHPSLKFAEKLSELQQAGRISPNEFAILEVLVHAGNAAAHRGWEPTDDEVHTMFSILESFVFRNCLDSNAITLLKSSVPIKPKLGAPASNNEQKPRDDDS